VKDRTATTTTSASWLTTAEAAELLGVSIWTVRRRAEAGALRSKTERGKTYVYIEERPARPADEAFAGLPPVMETTHVADFLGWGERRVRRWLAGGHMPGRKAGSKWFVSRAQLDDWMRGEGP
jgi:excisionase family DNA binding protein